MIDTTQFSKLLILKRHWQLAVAVSLTVIAVIVPVALGIPNVYSASTNLTVERRGSPAGGQATIESLDSRLQKIKRDAVSRRNVTDLIEKLNLYPALRKTASIETVINRVQSDFTVTPHLLPSANGSQSLLSFTLSYVGDDPAMVANVANTLASFFVEQNSQMRVGQVSRATELLKEQRDDAQRRLDEATAKTTAFRTKNADRLPEQTNRKSQELAGVNQDLAAKVGRQNALRERRNTLTQNIAAEMNRPTAGTSALTPEQQLTAALRELDAFGAGATDLVPGVAQAKAKIAALQRTVDDRKAHPAAPDSATTVLGSLEQALATTNTDLASADADVEKGEQHRAALVSYLDHLPTSLPELENLNSEARIARDFYEGLDRQYTQALMTERTERTQDGDEFKVFEAANVPTIPYGPNRLNLILAGIFVAIVAGLGAAVARDLLDTSFHSLDELRTFTQVPVLASIPKITTGPQRARRMVSTLVMASALIVGLAFVSVGVYRYAQQHVGITRLLSKPN